MTFPAHIHYLLIEWNVNISSSTIFYLFLFNIFLSFWLFCVFLSTSSFTFKRQSYCFNWIETPKCRNESSTLLEHVCNNIYYCNPIFQFLFFCCCPMTVLFDCFRRYLLLNSVQIFPNVRLNKVYMYILVLYAQ